MIIIISRNDRKNIAKSIYYKLLFALKNTLDPDFYRLLFYHEDNEAAKADAEAADEK